MSDHRAIGGVCECIKNLLMAYMEQKTTITIVPPDAAGEPDTRINLFLYRIEESAALKNQDLPGQAPGAAFGRPPLALELHLMLTAYGPPDDGRKAQELLGDAMRALHEYSIVPQSLLDASVRPLFEAIRISMQPVSLDELTKIWSATTKPLRLSAFYRITAIQIEQRRPRHYAPVVREPPAAGPQIVAIPMSRARITGLRVIRPEEDPAYEHTTAYARVGDRLVIEGEGFTAESRVLFGATEMEDDAKARSDRRMIVAIPAAGLELGPVCVRVRTDVRFGDQRALHRGFESNVAVFVLIPHVEKADFDPATRELTITGTRLFQDERPCFTLVGSRLFPANLYLADPTESKIRVKMPEDLAAGTYSVRVRVNGAESVDGVVAEIKDL